MKIIFDKQTGILNIKLKEEPSIESAEIGNSVVVDYNANGEVVGIEINDVHQIEITQI